MFEHILHLAFMNVVADFTEDCQVDLRAKEQNNFPDYFCALCGALLFGINDIKIPKQKILE